MKMYVIVALIGALLVAAAFLTGKEVTKADYKDNLNEQIIIQKNNDTKVNSYSDRDMCVTVLRGKLSESGECE